MAEKPDFDKIFANKATSVHEWDKDNYDTGWGFLGETPPPYELFDSLQRENDTKTKYLYEKAEEINTDLTQDINNLQSDLNSKYNELKTGLGSTNTALQQHNVDENAHANLFQRALVTEAKTAANTVDWNTLTESRTYKISGATFAADKHQPVGAVGTGELVVLKNGDDTIAQVYYANSAAYDKAGTYHRMCISGTWTDWVYNITNKGGNITGDFNINGKLTVDSLDIKNNFTVAGGTPVTGDDLQKVQDQIIAPLQTFYVSNNGSDNNDGTSLSKAFKTFSPIYDRIKKDALTLRIYIDNTCDDLNYILTKPFDFNSQIGGSGSQGKGLVITPINYELAANTDTRATIYVPYGKAFSNYGSSNRYDYYGHILAAGCSSITLTGLNIKLQNKGENNYSGFLLNSPDITISRCNIELQTYDLSNTFWVNSLTGVNLSERVNITGSGYLINATSVNRYTTDPSLSEQAEQPREISTLAVTQNVYVERLISGVNTTVDSNILNKGNHACTSDVYVNFSNIGS